MDMLENTTAQPALTEEPTDAPVQSNLGMKLLVAFIVLIGGSLIIDLFRAWFRS